jgi:hypothetical protein
VRGHRVFAGDRIDLYTHWNLALVEFGTVPIKCQNVTLEEPYPHRTSINAISDMIRPAHPSFLALKPRLVGFRTQFMRMRRLQFGLNSGVLVGLVAQLWRRCGLTERLSREHMSADLFVVNDR